MELSLKKENYVNIRTWYIYISIILHEIFSQPFLFQGAHNDWVFDICWLDDEFLVTGTVTYIIPWNEHHTLVIFL